MEIIGVLLIRGQFDNLTCEGIPVIQAVVSVAEMLSYQMKTYRRVVLEILENRVLTGDGNP